MRLSSHVVATGGAATIHAGDVGGTACVVKVAHANAVATASLAREEVVLARLGAPWAPALLSRHDMADGRPALAIERIEGLALSAWCADASDTARLAVATRFVDRLAGVHARGVIHGDLSGANVLVTADGDVRLIDFGAARMRHHVAGTRNGPRVATPAYLAPAAADRPASIADDIYAAGVLLFELCTGRRPFEGANAELRRSHALRRPPMASQRASVSVEIDHVIGRCLAKNPSRRFRDAGALREAWIAAARRPARLARGTAPARPLVTPSIEGRGHAILLGFRPSGDLAATRRMIECSGGTLAHADGGVCVAAWFRCADPEHAAANARARLAQAGSHDFLEQRTAVKVDARGVVRGAAVLRLAARVSRGERPSSPPRVPLFGREQELACLTDGAAAAIARGRPILMTIEGEPGAGKTRLLDVFASTSVLAMIRIAGTMGDPAAALADLDATLEGRSTCAPASRAARIATLAERIADRAAHGGLVLVLDDVQWMDSAVVDAAALAVRTSDACGLAVVIAGRPGSVATTAVRSAGARHVPLQLAPLDGAHAAALCRALLHDVIAVPTAVIDRLVARAGGLPLLIHEVVRGLREDGAIRGGRLDIDAAGAGASVAVIEHVLDRELERIGPDLRAHTYLAAVLGSAAGMAETARVVEALDRHGQGELAPFDPEVAIGRLVDAGVLVVRTGRVELRHALVRDAVLRRIPDAAHRAIATAAHEALAGLADDAVRASWAEVAGQRETAIAGWLAVRAAARARHDYLTVEHACSRGIDLLDTDDGRRSEWLAERARARYRLGRHADAAADFAAAGAFIHESVARAGLLLDEAMALDWARDFETARMRTEQAASLVPRDRPPSLAAALELALGRSAWRAGDRAAARPRLERALAMASVLGDDGDELTIVSGIVLGWVLAELDELALAQSVLAAAGVRASAMGDRVHEAAALNNQAYVLWRRGAVDQLAAIHRRVVTLGRELGMPTQEYRAESWMFKAALVAGRSDVAAACAERMVAFERTFPELFPAPLGTLAHARIAACSGDAATARERMAGLDASTLSPLHRAIAQAITMATNGELVAERWCELVRTTAAGGNGEAAMEVAQIGIAFAIDLRTLVADVAGTLSLSPAVRATICT